MIRTFVGGLLLAGAMVHGAQGPDDLRQRMLVSIDQDYPYVFALYRHLHQHPELSFAETNTARRIGDELAEAGFEVHRHIGGHGVVGILRNGKGPTVLARTDLDGLPVTEQTGLPYASEAKAANDTGGEVSVMHACGHDVHMASLVGAARQLARFREGWRGTLVFIGQPAEERGAGAKAMLADGLFDRFPKPDFGIAQHVAADLPAGTVGFTPGFAMANVDSIDILVRGRGGHGAAPHTTLDPIVLASQLVLSLQTIVSREIDPLAPAVLTVGSIHGGTKHNVIPDEVALQLTLRTYEDEIRDQIIEAIRRKAEGLAWSAGIPKSRHPIVAVQDEYTPAAYNDPTLTRRLAAVMAEWIGEDHVVDRPPAMIGEDFGRYGRTEDKIPITMLFTGSVAAEAYLRHRDEGTTLPSLHSARFAPDPDLTLRTGVTLLVASILELTGHD